MNGAYALKKIVPRLLVGIILINISIYIVAGMVDLTNVLGQGVGSLITAPFHTQASYNYTLGKGTAEENTVVVVGLGALAIQGIRSPTLGSGVSKTTSDIFKGGKTAGQTVLGALHFILIFVIVPLALLMLAILVTLVFRQALLILLAVSVPIACVLYILPNTEKFARKWLDAYWKALLMYPIIMIIFAISDVMTSIIFHNNQDSLIGVFAGLITQLAPLVLIPFSFKFAGAALGGIAGAVSNYRGKLGQSGILKRNREKAAHWWQRQKDEGAEQRLSKAETRLARADPNSAHYDPNYKLGRYRRLRANAITGNLASVGVTDRIAHHNVESDKQVAEKIAAGNEQEVRAVTATLQRRVVKNADGSEKLDANGNAVTREGYWSLDNREVTRGEYERAHKRAATDAAYRRSAFAHVINKTSDQGEYANFKDHLADYQADYHMTDHEAHAELDSVGQQTHAPWLRRTETDHDGKTYARVDKVAGDHSHQTSYQLIASPHAHQEIRDQSAMAADIMERAEAGGTLSAAEVGFMDQYKANIENQKYTRGGQSLEAVAAQAAADGSITGQGAASDTIAAIKEAEKISSFWNTDRHQVDERVYDDPASPNYVTPVPQPVEPAAIPVAEPNDSPLRRQYALDRQQYEQDMTKFNAYVTDKRNYADSVQARVKAKHDAALANTTGRGMGLRVGDSSGNHVDFTGNLAVDPDPDLRFNPPTKTYTP